MPDFVYPPIRFEGKERVLTSIATIVLTQIEIQDAIMIVIPEADVPWIGIKKQAGLVGRARPHRCS